MRLSARVRRIAPSSTIAVMTEAKKLAARGIDVVDLGPGEPDFPTPPPIAEAGIEAIRAGHTRYTPVAGIPPLRSALAEAYRARHGVELRSENVLVAAGGKQALANACLSLFEAGDDVLVPTPCWVSFPEMVALADARPVLVDMDPADGLRPSFDRLEAAWTERTRGVIVCSPANPHGAIVRRSDLDRLVALARERDAVVLFDECYEEFVYDGDHVSAIGHLDGGHVLVSGTFSKSFAMTGWRVGWLVGPADLVAAATNLQGHTTTNASSIAQHAALAALSDVGRATIAPMIEEFRERRDLLVAGLRRIPGISCDVPEGAFYAFPDVRDLCGRLGLTDSLALARLLIEEARVAVVPGEAFAAPGHLRLSFATSRERLRDALERMEELVSARLARAGV